jgi:hypothetical protein
MELRSYMNGNIGVLDLTSAKGIKSAYAVVGGASSDMIATVIGAYLGTTASAITLISAYQALGLVGWGGVSLIPIIAPWAAPWLVPVLSSLGITHLPIVIFTNPIGIPVLVGIATLAGLGAVKAKKQIKKLAIRASQLALVNKFLDTNGNSGVPELEIKAYEDEKLMDQILDTITQNKWYKLTHKSKLQIGGRSGMHLFLKMS